MANEAQMSGGVQGIGRAVQALGVGEKLAVLGSVGVVVVWFVFHLLTQDYSVGQVPFVLSAGTVFLAYRYHVAKAEEWPLAYATLVIALAGTLGAIGVRELLLDLRYEIFDVGGATLVGAILFWIAAIAAGVGAVQMAMGRR